VKGLLRSLAQARPGCHESQSQLCSVVFLQVAAKALEMGVFGAYFNVLINLRDVTDDVFKDQVGRRWASCQAGYRSLSYPS
jgi:formiminotetrahydrofolate cyclodeaminase